MQNSKGLQSTSVIWITGLSGSGKTTLATELALQIKIKNNAVVMLDGDILRTIFCPDFSDKASYDRASRIELAMQYSKLCHELSKQRITVIIATISLFKEIHSWNRENLPGYFEIYLKVPMQTLRQRDPKGIYKKFDAGQLINVAGLDLKVDEPANPDLILDDHDLASLQHTVSELINTLF